MDGKDNKVIKNIQRYLTKENTDYSILLKGKWGCGKTHFIKKVLEEELEEYKLVYTSVAGITDITEFINNIYLIKASKAIDSKHTLGTIKAFNKYSSYIGDTIKDIAKVPVEKMMKELVKDIGKKRISFSKTLIVIDDLERISDKINIEDFLYSIYDTFISEKVKVLFIANEDEIDNKDNNYTNIKEKIIRYTIDLYDIENEKITFENAIENEKITFENTINSIIKGKSKDIEKYFIDDIFLKENINHIKKIFSTAKYCNLRTFLKYLDLSEDILSIDDRLKQRKNIFNEILLLLAITLIELEMNKEKIKNLVSGDNYSIRQINDGNRTGTEYISKTTMEGPQEIKDYIKDLTNKYNKCISINSYYNIFDMQNIHKILKIFINYINTSFLDEGEIKNIYNAQLKIDKKNDEASHIFLNPNTFETEEVKQSIEILNQKIKKEPLYFDLQYLSLFYEKYNHCSYIDELDKDIILKAIEQNIIEKVSKATNTREVKNCEYDFKQYQSIQEMNKLIGEKLENRKNEIIDDFKAKLLDSFKEKRFALVFNNKEYESLYHIKFDIIFGEDFLDKIEVTPYSITTLKDFVKDMEKMNSWKDMDEFKKMKKLLKNIEKFIEKQEKNNHDEHIKYQIDILKEATLSTLNKYDNFKLT